MKKIYIIAAIILLTLFMILGSVLYIQKGKQSPENVFFKAIENSLTTDHVTTVANRKLYKGTGEISTTIDLSDGNPRMTQHHLAKNDDGSIYIDNIITATLKEIYFQAKHVSNQENSKDTELPAEIQSLWGKTNEEASPQRLPKELYSFIPIASLNKSEAKKVMQAMKEQKTYSIVPETVKYSSSNNTKITEFDVKVSVSGLSKSIEELNNITKYVVKSQKPKDANSDDVPLQTIHVKINQSEYKFISMNGPDKDSKLTYSSPGTKNVVAIPSNTIPLDQLQAKISSYLASQ